MQQPLGQTHLAVFDANPLVGQQHALFLLSAEGQVGARRSINERRRPVNALHGLVHLRGGHPGSVQPADDRTHAGADDTVHRNAQFLQHLEHADMRDAARPATAQRQTDAGAARRSVGSVDHRQAAWREEEQDENQAG